MGGAVAAPGNATHVAEFNIWSDPEAAALVLSAGLPLTLVPLDVTERVVLCRAAVEEAASRGPIPAWRVQACTGVDVERFTRLFCERVLDEPPEG